MCIQCVAVAETSMKEREAQAAVPVTLRKISCVTLRAISRATLHTLRNIVHNIACKIPRLAQTFRIHFHTHRHRARTDATRAHAPRRRTRTYRWLHLQASMRGRAAYTKSTCGRRAHTDGTHARTVPVDRRSSHADGTHGSAPPRHMRTLRPRVTAPARRGHYFLFLEFFRVPPLRLLGL